MTGFFGAPRSTYDTTSFYLNDGFIMEEQRQVDPNDPSKGTIPFHRRYATPLELTGAPGARPELRPLRAGTTGSRRRV